MGTYRAREYGPVTEDVLRPHGPAAVATDSEIRSGLQNCDALPVRWGLHRTFDSPSRRALSLRPVPEMKARSINHVR